MLPPGPPDGLHAEFHRNGFLIEKSLKNVYTTANSHKDVVKALEKRAKSRVKKKLHTSNLADVAFEETFLPESVEDRVPKRIRTADAQLPILNSLGTVHVRRIILTDKHLFICNALSQGKKESEEMQDA